MTATTNKPPRTPPIIAPTGVDFLGEGEGVDDGAVVEEFVKSGNSITIDWY